MPLATAIASLVGAAGVIAWRSRETKRAVSARSILIPPLAMSTGLAMFVVPQTRIPWSWAAVAFFTGALLFSQVLVRTSTMAREGDVVVLRRSKAFLWILLGLVAVRLVLRSYVERYVSPMQTGSVFYLLAFGMIVTWRITMYRRFRQLRDEAVASPAPDLSLPIDPQPAPAPNR